MLKNKDLSNVVKKKQVTVYIEAAPLQEIEASRRRGESLSETVTRLVGRGLHRQADLDVVSRLDALEASIAAMTKQVADDVELVKVSLRKLVEQLNILVVKE